ncbi:uncharacterized protein [Malus domestica]|uniref:uncharacterized protein n=1 Tax=Malus domestica TaxID=3750 RepID=UPI00397563C5
MVIQNAIFRLLVKGVATYGEWTKAHPVRDVMEPLRMLNVGMGERRQAGEVRGSGLPQSQNQRGGRVLTSPRGDVTRAIAPRVGSAHQGSSKKKWRRKPRSLVSTDQVPGNEADGDRPSITAVEEGCSHSSFSGSQHAGGWQSGSLIAITEDFFTLGGVAEWGSDMAVRALHGLIRNKRPSMIFLFETKMKDHRIDGVKRRLGFLNDFNVSPVGRAGGLSLWWDDTLVVQIVFSSHNIIDDVQRIKGDNRWICGGDFNEYIWAYEKAGGVEVLYNRPRYLEDFMNFLNLFDLGFNELAFTWRGLRYGDWVEERLDRVLVNDLWQDLWPNSTFTHGTVLASDHCPLIIKSDLDGLKGMKLFRFEAFWAKEEECQNLGRKLTACRSSLCRWSSTKFKRRGLQIQDLLAQLDDLQRDWGSNQDVIREKSQFIDDLRAQEESFWCQRSRVKWLRDGDANTKFFHHSTLHRRRRNTIVKLKDKGECWVERPDQVRHLVENYFVDIFSSAGSRNWGSSLDCISHVVSDAMNMVLVALVSDDKIKEAALEMGCLKTPGLDGFQGVFYQSFWETVRTDVLALVKALIQDSTISERKAKNKFELGIKLDMQKAYDRVEWDFLEAVMEKMGFCLMWRKLIMGCVNSVQFNVILNGQHGTIFAPSRDENNCRHLSDLLATYCEASGTYLGVPAIWGRSKKRGHSYVKGRILEKMQGWKQSSLSRVRKEVLIKVVVQVIPAYLISIFTFPAIVCQELDSLVADFWWGNKDGARKMHWVSKDARVIKARYFPHCNIWEATKGGRASWAWSSILTGRDLLKLGSHWQILGGQDVRVWVDKWLPSLSLGHSLPFGSVPVTSSLRVSSLICPVSRRWDLNFLLPFLSDTDKKAIKDTPIGDLSHKDRIILGCSKNGIYTVKSGYRWIQSRSLALRDNRLSTARGTIGHLFLNCSWVEPIWFGGALNYKIDRDAIHSWVDWLKDVWSSSFASSTHAKWMRSYIAYTCWFIWKTRCDFVYNKVPINPSKVLFALSTVVGSFLASKDILGASRLEGSGRVGHVSRWCAPTFPFIKINIDASWSKVSKLGFAGVVMQATEGRFVAAARYPFSAPSAAAVEALALLRGCELGVALGINALIIESDSLDAVNCLSGFLEMGSWESFPVLARVKQLGEAFQFCRWSWVPRSANGAAHELASVGFTEMSDSVRVERPPSSLVFVLNNDGLPCPH